MVLQGSIDQKNHHGHGTTGGDNLSFVTLIDFRHEKNSKSAANNKNNNNSLKHNNHSSIHISNLAHPSSLASSRSNTSQKKTQQYLRFGGSDIYETQCLSSKGNDYGSFFVGSRIVSNGSMHVTTRIDPLFFVLSTMSHLKSSSNNDNHNNNSKSYKWQPLDQLLKDLPDDIQKAVLHPNPHQMKNLFDTTDKFGDDMILYKFNETRTLGWLHKKQSNAHAVLQTQLLETKRRQTVSEKRNESITGGTGAFHSTFHFADDDNDGGSSTKDCTSCSTGNNKDASFPAVPNTTKLTKQEEKQVFEASLQVVCEYLSAEWTEKLCNSLNFHADAMSRDSTTAITTTSKEDSITNVVSPGGEMENVRIKSSTVSTKGFSTTWEGLPGEEEIDQVMQLTTGVGASIHHDSKHKNTTMAKKVNRAQSVGLKRLAKVNKKGMKSLTSFFGGPAKKKVKR